MKRYTATVTEIVRETPDTITIHFQLPASDRFSYTAGQYITVFFDDSTTPEGKAYSLSSAPHEPGYSITVKKIGEYSGRLHALKPGETFSISAAYGFFNPQTNRPLVCLGAGCGLSPILSIVKDELSRDAEKVAHIFCSSKTTDDIVFARPLAEHTATHTNLHVTHHITRQQEIPELMRKGRIDLDHCVQAIEDEAVYLVCGSVDFVRDMWRGLINRGISPDAINTETFFE